MRKHGEKNENLFELDEDDLDFLKELEIQIDEAYFDNMNNESLSIENQKNIFNKNQKNEDLEVFNIEHLFNFTEEEKKKFKDLENEKIKKETEKIKEEEIKKLNVTNVKSNHSIFEEIHKKEIDRQKLERELRKKKLRREKKKNETKINNKEPLKKRNFNSKVETNDLYENFNPYTNHQINFIKNFLQQQELSITLNIEDKKCKKNIDCSTNSFKLDSTLDSNCVICLKNCKKGEEVRKFQCCHIFHKNCIDQWMQEKLTCPLCRKNLFNKLI
jgi:hypothetical protein